MDFRVKKIFASILFLIFFFLSFGQNNENFTIGILPLKSDGIEEEKVKKVTQKIEIAFFNSQRFQLVSRQLQDAIKAERERNKDASNIDDIAIQQGKAIGADYVVKGTISSIDRKTNRGVRRTPNSRNNNTPQIYTSTNLNLTLNVVEVKTGIIKATDEFKGSLNGLDQHIKNFIRKEFPFTFNILEILNDKSDRKTKSVLIDGGFRQGLYYGVIMKVYEVTVEKVEGQEFVRESQVGDLYVRAVDFSGNFSKCILKKGRKSILKKIEEGKIIVARVPAKMKFLGMQFEYEY